MNGKTIFCSICDISVGSKVFSSHLKSKVHKDNSAIQVSEGIQKITSAFRSRIASYRVSDESTGSASLPPTHFLNHLRPKVRALIEARCEAFQLIKVSFEYFAEFSLPKTFEIAMKSFSSENICIYPNYSFDELFTKVVSNIGKQIEEFQEKDSGWSFLKNSYLEVNINKYSPLRGGSSYVEIPKSLRYRKALLNIKNNDVFCFLWSVMAAMFPSDKNADRVSSYPHFRDILNVDNIDFPMSLKDIKTFEKNNKEISINIYGLNNNNQIVGPLYKTQQRKKHHVNLLFIEAAGYSHYCLIRNLCRLVKPQITKHHDSIFFCEECLLFFNSKNKLDIHICGGVATHLPDKGSVLQFKHFEKMQDVPFVIYADFESLLQDCEDEAQSSSHTIKLQKHIPAAFGYYVVCLHDSSLNRYVSYRGDDCVIKFIEEIQRDVSKIHKIFTNPKPIIFTEEDEINFRSAQNCYICKNMLFDDRVRDHSHLSGLYRGPAHFFCNLKFSLPKFVPVFFHNLSGYDAHLFIKELGETPGDIKVIAKTKENYISFTKFIKVGETDFMAVRFVDSFKFLGTSLEKLVQNLGKDDFVHLSKHFQNNKQCELLQRKGIYPYQYMNDWSCFNENSLPPRTSFFNSLTNQSITKSEYEHAKKVWKIFDIQSMGEYTDLYLKTDVLLLSDVFENFRHISKTHYRLDPAFYLTAPSLSFDAMLLKTGVKLELVDDLEVVRLLKESIRGGISLCSKKMASANNKYMEEYDEKLPNEYLIYIDCNNLYGHAMCAYLPQSNFKLMNSAEICLINFTEIADDAEYGYILEVDLEYPEHLHDLHDDIPFCPQNFKPPSSKTEKLIPNLYDKYHYVIHYMHLKTCLKHGLKLLKVHRVIEFRQSPYLKQYIDLNTHLRTVAKSKCEQDFFKLLNNSIFGKTLEDTEKRLQVRLVNQWTDLQNKTKKRITAQELIARPNYQSSTIFTENLVGIQMKPERIVLDKPIYIGFSVLEISKRYMYDFHYSIMKPFYKDKIKLCYTDTDSFLYSVETEDFYNDLKNNFIQYFDTSNYPDNNIYGIECLNKKVPGLFKDEFGGQVITEFVGLRSKLYCLKTKEVEVKKAKGVKRHVLDELSYKDYNDVLLKNETIRKRNILFKSLKHEIFTQSVNKVALSSNDDKRILLRNKICTTSWGHYKSFS